MSSTFEDLNLEDLDAVIAADAFSSEFEKHVTVPVETGPVDTGPVDAAARLLEVAALNADQLVAEAREEAEGLVRAAQIEAERVRADFEAEQVRLTEEIASLRREQREYRERMREHLHEMLAKLAAEDLAED